MHTPINLKTTLMQMHLMYSLDENGETSYLLHYSKMWISLCLISSSLDKDEDTDTDTYLLHKAEMKIGIHICSHKADLRIQIHNCFTR